MTNIAAYTLHHLLNYWFMYEVGTLKSQNT